MFIALKSKCYLYLLLNAAIIVLSNSIQIQMSAPDQNVTQDWVIVYFKFKCQCPDRNVTRSLSIQWSKRSSVPYLDIKIEDAPFPWCNSTRIHHNWFTPIQSQSPESTNPLKMVILGIPVRGSPPDQWQINQMNGTQPQTESSNG